MHSQLVPVMFLAMEEARMYSCQDAGTEHILIALIRNPSELLAEVFGAYCLDLSTVRQALQELDVLHSGARSHPSPSLVDILLTEVAGWESSGSQHILERVFLVVIAHAEYLATKILRRLGVDPSDVRCKVMELVAQSIKYDVLQRLPEYEQHPLLCELVAQREQLHSAKITFVAKGDLAGASQISEQTNRVNAQMRQILRKIIHET